MLRKLYISFICLLCAGQAIRAQTGVFIPPGANVMAHRADTVSIFSNVTNQGRFGSATGSAVLFYGGLWSNTDEALLPEERFYDPALPPGGGVFRFMQPLTGEGRQTIFGGYNSATGIGASFPNLYINNPSGVQLADLSDLRIRYNLHFESGHLYLNGWDVAVGGEPTGRSSITGYTSRRFIVTGTSPYGGYLYLYNVNAATGEVVFPIGTGTDSYTPLALRYNGRRADNFRVRVFDNVYANAQTGSRLEGNLVPKTWQILQNGIPNGDSIAVSLQHNAADQNTGFTGNIDSSFISRYSPVSGWDTVPRTGFSQPGTLTTGNPLRQAYMHSRTLSATPGGTFLSLFALKVPEAPGFEVSLIFDAIRRDVRQVQATWLTMRERDVQHFELERRLEHENDFRAIAVLPTQSPTGNSNVNRQYQFMDDNYYGDMSYYRLKTISRNGDSTYSPIRSVPGNFKITASPNPNRGQFTITLSGVRNLLRMDVIDIKGKVIYTTKITGTNMSVNVANAAVGVYFLVFYDTDNNNVIVDRQKIEIIK
ncbi:T9SS type A sorting domain-containing protein [Chitinophaga sp. GCM10012297]|uniref:T9SS type A sorting domain-containing protein n=1 Tax=Chitinophaga chungangae TaxID=2821488 RepID=A0ABS3YCH5_9BACT|nr:T9SS type A sorting domain-containing protein [Chitinophaga chungangae]MBO9152384.1 T9SS type A sorting domain-containing protein [Chitinophaga chungangae]